MRRTILALVLLAAAAALWLAARTQAPEPPAVGPAATERDGQRAPTPSSGKPRAAEPERRDDTASPSPAEPGAGRIVEGVVRAKVGESAPAPWPDVEVLLVPVDAGAATIADAPIPDFGRAATSCRTGADGTFEIRGVPQGEFVVLARADGFTPDASVVEDGEAAQLYLVQAPIRRFRVTDVRGRPVEGAALYLSREWGGDLGGCTLSDARGEAQFCCSRFHFVRVRARGFADQGIVIAPDAGIATPIEVVLSEGLAVRGRVVDGDGRAVGGVRVSLSDGNGTASVAPVTREDGAFEFAGLDMTRSVAKWTVAAERQGLVADETPVVPGDLGVRVVMRRPATIRGLVVHADGTPATGARVWPFGRPTDEGRFALERMVPGRAEIWARVRSPVDPCMELDGYAVVELPEGGEVDGVRVVVGPPKDQSFVLVKVMDGEKPEEAHVIVWQDGVSVGDSWYGGDESKRDGAVLVKVRKPPGALVHLGASISPPRTSAPFDGRTKEPVVTEDAPPFTPRAIHLAAPARVRIRAVAADAKEIPAEALHVETNSVRNEDGTFAAREVDWFRATVSARGFVPREVGFAPPHPALRDESVRLVPATRLFGRVVGEDGRVAEEGAEVRLSVDGETVATSTADAAGGFRFDVAPGCRGELRVARDGRIVLHRAVSVGEEPLDLGDLRVGATREWRIVVVDASGQGVGGATVAPLDRGGEELSPERATRPDGSAEARLPSSVPPRFLLRRPGLATRVVDPAPDAAQPLRIVLVPAGSVRVRVARWADAGWGDLSARVAGTSVEWDPHWARGSVETGNVYDDLPPGPVELVLRMQDREIVRRAEIVAEEIVDVVFGE